MGFLSNAFKSIAHIAAPVLGAVGGGLLGNLISPGLAGTGALIGGSIGGSLLQGDAVNEAQRQAQQSSDKQMALLRELEAKREALAREGIAAYTAASDKAQGFLQGAYDSTAPARAVVGNAATMDERALQPWQTRAAADFQRQLEAHQAAAGIRGSGNANAAALDAMARNNEAMWQANHAEKMNAADTLTREGFGTIVPQADIARGVGSNTSTVLTNVGNNNPLLAGADVIGNQYRTQAQGDLAQGSLTSDALGTILGQLSDTRRNDPAYRFSTARPTPLTASSGLLGGLY